MSIPIVLPVSSEDKERLENKPSLTLKYNGKSVAVLRDPEFYPHRKEERASRQFGTPHKGHPYIKVSFPQGNRPLTKFNQPRRPIFNFSFMRRNLISD